MLAVGKVYRKTGTTTWNPNAAFLTDREPVQTPDLVLYEGPMRVQPNLSWRGRKQRWGDVTITEHAINLQIDLQENTVTGADPIFAPNDYAKVTEVHELDGVSVSSQLLHTIYIVRVVAGSSNAWQQSLLCDQDQSQVSVPR
jgi:hypothetical protein